MRKISAHYVFSGNSKPLRNGIVTINDEGEVVDISDTEGRLMPAERLEHLNGILVPGLINAHCHLELSHLKGGIKEGGNLSEFLSQIVSHRNVDRDIIEQAAKEADREMFRNGIRAVGDISNEAVSFDIKRYSPILYHTFIESTGIDPQKAEVLFARAIRLEEQASEMGLTSCITSHAPYSVSTELAHLIREQARKRNTPLSIHHLESEAENEFLREGRGPMKETFSKINVLPNHWEPYGTSSTEHLVHMLPEQYNHTLLVHNTFATTCDIEFIKSHWPETYWVVCPSSNLLLEKRLPDIPLFRKAGLNICLGTDSYASNTALSILKEMQIIQEYFPEVSLQELVLWATLNGAKGLGMHKKLGSIEPGKVPGLNLITGVNYHNMKLTSQSQIQRVL